MAAINTPSFQLGRQILSSAHLTRGLINVVTLFLSPAGNFIGTAIVDDNVAFNFSHQVSPDFTHSFWCFGTDKTTS